MMAKVETDAAPVGRSVRSVATPIYPGVTPHDVTGPSQMLDLANRLRKQHL